MRWILIAAHLAFWSLFYYFFLWVHLHFYSFNAALLKTSLNLALFVIVFYTNSRILIERFLEKKKISLYVVSITILLISGTLLKYTIDHQFGEKQLPVQRIIAERFPFLGPFLFILFWTVFSFF